MKPDLRGVDVPGCDIHGDFISVTDWVDGKYWIYVWTSQCEYLCTFKNVTYASGIIDIGYIKGQLAILTDGYKYHVYIHTAPDGYRFLDIDEPDEDIYKLWESLLDT